MGRKFSHGLNNHTQATTEKNWMCVLATIVPRTGLIESSLRHNVGLVPRRVINILFVRVSEEQVVPRGLISTYPLIVRTHWLRVTAWQSNVSSVRCHPFIFLKTAQKNSLWCILTQIYDSFSLKSMLIKCSNSTYNAIKPQSSWTVFIFGIDTITITIFSKFKVYFSQ